MNTNTQEALNDLNLAKNIAKLKALRIAKKAYEEDVKVTPLYHDGSPRRAWDELSYTTKLSWVDDRHLFPEI